MKDKSNSHGILQARTIGSFFLLAFVAYGFGRHLFESTVNAEKYLGALLIIVNSILVLFIGILFRKTLTRYNVLVGDIYLYIRIFEAVALASIVLKLFLHINILKDLEYLLAMLILGLGSIPMCLLLYKHKISPPWLAIWGAAGYTLFSFGFLMELFGKAWSMYFLGFAGLWEIFFGIWLIIFGINNKKSTS
jgi:hypothetical protein